MLLVKRRSKEKRNTNSGEIEVAFNEVIHL